MVEYGLEWSTLTSYFQMVELASVPNTPQANQLRLYALDKAGASALYYKNDAGTVFDLSGVANAVHTTDADWLDLTDGGATTLHSHAGSVSIGSTITSATAGSVLFAGAAGVLAQDNANFFWDDTNNDLLLGTNVHPVTAVVGRGLAVARNTSSEIGTYTYVTGGTNTAGYRAGVFGGTIASPAGTTTGQGGFYAFSARDSSGNIYSPAFMAMFAAETQTSTARGSYITLDTTALGGTARTERFRVGPSGQWGIGGATFGAAGEVFTSGGAGAAPTWRGGVAAFGPAAPASITIVNGLVTAIS